MADLPPQPATHLEPPAQERLNSWKEIAAYLNRGARTVQRWEREEGLPVRRLRHDKLGSVYAYKSELDAWWASRGEKLQKTQAVPVPTGAGPARRRKLFWAALAVVLLLAGGFTAWRYSGLGGPGSPRLQITPLTSYPGYEGWSTFSPDGQQVAFGWEGEKQDNLDIYAKYIGVDPPLRLTTDPTPDTDPAWAPEGRSIAFLRRGSSVFQVWLVPALGGPERKLAEIVNLYADLPEPLLAWTPDSQWLVAVDKPSEKEPFALVLISARSGDKRNLTAPPLQSLGDSAPAVSPDGKKLAFIRCSTIEVCDIYVQALMPGYTAAGAPVRLTDEKAGVFTPLWLPGGKELLYARRQMLQADMSSLWRIPVDGAVRPRPEGSTGNLGTHISMSSRGDRLAYTASARDRNIYRLELSGRSAAVGTPLRLTSSTRAEQQPSIAPGGNRLAFVSYRTGTPEIWVSNADGSNPAPLTSFGGPITSTPRWSPDGNEIAFDSRAGGDAEVYVINASGGSPRALTSEPSNDCVPSWSADGRWIYFASDRSGEFQVWKMPRGGGAAVQVTRHGGYVAFESPDGKDIYYVKSYGYGGTTLWRAPAAGGDEVKVLDSVRSRHNFYVVAEGIWFMHSRVESSGFPLCFYRFATGRVERVWMGDQQPALGLSAWPCTQPRWLYFALWETAVGDLMLVENFR